MPDVYDLQYPGEVAGHVEAGSFIGDESMIPTTRGPDAFFDGDSLTTDERPHKVEGGSEQVNRQIGEAIRKSKEDVKNNEVAQEWRLGNVTLQDNRPVRIITANTNRKSVVISNQSSATVYVGRESGLIAQGPNTIYLPPGIGRTFTHTRDIWVVGVTGQIVDFVEENYT